MILLEDPLEYFKQFEELDNKIPKIANHNLKSENADYSNGVGNSKNVYYSFTIHRSEDVYYSNTCTAYNNNLFNCTNCFKSSYLNNCTDCHTCNLSHDLFQCKNCRNAYFSIDCQGCSEIIFCTNLRNKSYCINNTELPKKEYLKKKEEILDGKHSTYLKNKAQFQKIWLQKPWKFTIQNNCEDCIGHNLNNCSNCYACFDCNNLENAKYVWDATPSETQSNSMDMGSSGIGEWLYECIGIGGGNSYLNFCVRCRCSANLTYCINCYSCRDCFLCTGLRNNKYCILNKQYSKEEYEQLVPKIIDHMQKNKEWGEFFPSSFSPFAYNERSEERRVGKECRSRWSPYH